MQILTESKVSAEETLISPLDPDWPGLGNAHTGTRQATMADIMNFNVDEIIIGFQL